MACIDYVSATKNACVLSQNRRATEGPCDRCCASLSSSRKENIVIAGLLLPIHEQAIHFEQATIFLRG